MFDGHLLDLVNSTADITMELVVRIHKDSRKAVYDMLVPGGARRIKTYTEERIKMIAGIWVELEDNYPHLWEQFGFISSVEKAVDKFFNNPQLDEDGWWLFLCHMFNVSVPLRYEDHARAEEEFVSSIIIPSDSPPPDPAPLTITIDRADNLAFNSVALGDYVHSDPRYRDYYEAAADTVGGYHGIWEVVAALATALSYVEERSEEDLWSERDFTEVLGRAVNLCYEKGRVEGSLKPEYWLPHIRTILDETVEPEEFESEISL